MATRSSMLYMNRKKIVLASLPRRPWFATNTLSTHSRPHEVLPELRAIEKPEARLAVRPLEETPAYVNPGDCCGETATEDES
jgi:hypothetical protein